ncbi:unnamed protein product [Leptidea sinapis]|uniref:Uncharacterized protein n=1 Tax=Leptidea sinapis TaxID=189913 RepID=A0A5E4QTD0_9NEOP|nr:unnamed protein product [Leptidea sinapis]
MGFFALSIIEKKKKKSLMSRCKLTYVHSVSPAVLLPNFHALHKILDIRLLNLFKDQLRKIEYYPRDSPEQSLILASGSPPYLESRVTPARGWREAARYYKKPALTRSAANTQKSQIMQDFCNAANDAATRGASLGLSAYINSQWRTCVNNNFQALALGGQISVSTKIVLQCHKDDKLKRHSENIVRGTQ